MRTAWLSLGSNIEAERNIASAMQALERDFPEPRFSPVYRSAPVGFDGDTFINLVAAIETDLEPLRLKAALNALEDAHARDRSAPRWSSRTLDVDILLYDDLWVLSPELEIPREEITVMAHVLRPLADLEPDLRHPVTGRTIAELWADFDGPRDCIEQIDWPPGE
ncbi:MAG: 2-amino-4-hydroxy-6-hydroxymethyldihydropteridine diphosphokinase [Xanthomonadales bacterium]